MRTDRKTKPTRKPCPICAKKYWLVKDAEWVCKNHDHWYLTTCSGCRRLMFSDARGVCPICSPTDLREEPER